MKNATQFKFGWLIKTDINGNIIWDKKIGDYHVENFIHDFNETMDHGLILSGATAQYDAHMDPLFIKLNPCGEIEWCKIFLSPLDNTAPGVVALPNGEYLGMLQYYGGDAQHIRISIVKMDASGYPIWIKNLAQEDSTITNEEGLYLDVTPDSNYLVSGYAITSSLKPYFVKTDTTGEELWNLKWPVGAGGYAGRSAFTNNGLIYTASQLKLGNLPKVPYLLKYSTSGEVIGQYPLMGDTIYIGGAESLLIYNDSTLYAGITWLKYPYSFDGFCDILKIDTMGNHYMQRRMLNEDYPPSCIIKTFDDKIVAIGQFFVDTNWDIYMWKMNENLEDDTLYTQPFVYDSLCPYEIQSDTVLLDCGLFVNIDEIPTQEEYEATIKISPNPASDWVVLTLPDVLPEGKVEMVLYDVFGREMETQGRGEEGKRGRGEEGKRGSVLPSNRIIFLDVSAYSSGMYIAVVKDQKGRRYTGKFVVGR